LDTRTIEHWKAYGKTVDRRTAGTGQEGHRDFDNSIGDNWTGEFTIFDRSTAEY
jgi:hypothetical protein